MTAAHIKSKFSRGFTLIELLIVIAVLGVLAAATLAAIDPVDKLNAGNDSKVQADLRAVYDAATRTAVVSGYTPTTFDLSTTTGITELKAIPKSPYTGSNYVYFGANAGANAGNVVVCGEVRSKSNRTKSGVTSTQTAYFQIANGTACLRAGACAGAGAICP